MRLKTKIIIISILSAIVLGVAAWVVFGVVVPKINNEIEERRRIVRIEITDFPKLEYEVGEDADYSGLVIALIRKNGEVQSVAYSNNTASCFSFTGFDSSEPVQTQTIIVRYGDFTKQFYITIKEQYKPAPVLTAITLDPQNMPKTEYKVGEWLDTSGGMIIKHYNDGTTARTIIVNQYISGWSSQISNTPGTYTLTITYTEGGVLKKTNYDITVSE